MCGIIAVLGKPTDKKASDPQKIRKAFENLAKSLRDISALPEKDISLAQNLNELLKGTAGLKTLIEDTDLLTELIAAAPELEKDLRKKAAANSESEKNSAKNASQHFASQYLKAAQDFRLLADLIFNIRWDRLDFAQKVMEMLQGNQNPAANPIANPAAIEAMASVQIALAGINRVEVRGRDSAGIQIILYGEEFEAPQIYTYKVANEIGKLGDNVANLKSQIMADTELMKSLSSVKNASASVLAHTRWASVGLISHENAHPQDSVANDETLITAAINGDIDNYKELIRKYSLEIPSAVTTDSKVAPILMAGRIGDLGAQQAFQNTVSELEGSLAVVATSMANPDQMHLCLSGSGQGLYVGLTEDKFIIASEPYGLVAEADHYLRLEDEVVHLEASHAGSLKGISRLSLDGKSLPLKPTDLSEREISTKDIDRANHPHFFIKEIYEAPDSVQKTLNGRMFWDDSGDSEGKDQGEYRVYTDGEFITEAIKKRITSKNLQKIFVIGQGTAGVAARAVAEAIQNQIENISSSILVEPVLASELSSYALDEDRDMNDSLVIAVSQSGTTTDTNRTVELVRSRGAAVLSIVNRRNSDLVDRSDGVFYTSDGRDVEMSVASTKAFYSQAVAGILLGCVIADLLSAAVEQSQNSKYAKNRQKLLASLNELPAAMEGVLAMRSTIAEIAERVAPARRWWAVVGSGKDRIAAEEVRIKLSELCYKSISEDAIEDKKHIDLSSEPLILVCAAGLSGAVAQDMVKEIAIYRAHRAEPVIFTDVETAHLLAGLNVVSLPKIDSRVAFILSALAGHLFSYEAALAIDGGAAPLREIRCLIESALDSDAYPATQNSPTHSPAQKTVDSDASQNMSCEGEDLLALIMPDILPFVRQFEDKLRQGEYNGHLQVSTATRLSNLCFYATGTLGLDSYQLNLGSIGTPAQVIEDLLAELTKAIDELSRPIDAIRHQAKTITVGITRSDEAFLQIPLVAEIIRIGAPRDQLSYENLKMLAGLNSVVEEVAGYIRYSIQGDNLAILDRGGEAAHLESRVEKEPHLFGTKNRVIAEQKVLITRGRMDGRTVIIVPEIKNATPVGLTLLHIKAKEFLPSSEAAEVMKTYKGRYEILKDAVQETEPAFDEHLLGEIPITDLLDQPIAYLADKWSKSSTGKSTGKSENERASKSGGKN